MTSELGFERLTAGDGHPFDCWMQPPEGDPRGGLVLLQEIFGVTDQLKGVARTYAALGYRVAIPALFDRIKPGTVVPFDQAPAGRDLMMALNTGDVMHDIAAAVAALAPAGPVAVMGFCWGGGLALRAAQVCDIAAAVSFYGTRLTEYLDDDLKAPIQFHLGREDDHVPAEMRAAVQERFPQAAIHLYSAGHAFANDARESYRARAAQKAHDRAQAFLEGVMR